MKISSKIGLVVLKAALSLLCLRAIYHMLLSKNDIRNLVQWVELDWGSGGLLSIVAALFLVIPNWMLEAKKWNLAMNENGEFSYKESLDSILVGVTLGIFTPARAGEYVGRMMLLKKSRQPESLVATFRCSMAQNFVTILCGGFAFMLCLREVYIKGLNHNLIVVVGSVLLIVILFIYWNTAIIVRLLSNVKWISKYLGSIKNVGQKPKLQLELLLLSIGRYMIYVIQFVLVLKFCGITGGLVLGFHVMMIYFLQTLLPLPPIAAFFARTSVAMLVLSSLGLNELAVMLASLILWVINMTLPALCGLVLIIRHKK